MFKKVGFIFLMVLLVILIRPHLFFERAPTKSMSDFSDDSSLETNKRGDNNSTNYAEGYTASDFGEAFKAFWSESEIGF